LRDIERRLGVVLFERTNGGTHLTTMGLEFIVSAQRILDEVDTELRRLKSRSRGELGLLTIGVHASPSAGNMRATLVEYHRRFPDVEVRTVDGSQDRLLRALAGNAVDIAIMTGRSSASRGARTACGISSSNSAHAEQARATFSNRSRLTPARSCDRAASLYSCPSSDVAFAKS